MTVVHLVGFPALLELLAGVLPEGFQHPVAHRAARGRPSRHERLVNQPSEEIQDIVFLNAASRAHPPQPPESIPRQIPKAA